eukprot:TRINITY_DN784_c0_g1_i3.p1 TRINITY_DN784_c0_g1~~TRINITY_DN784_c0_g1_i3.p1  ORF type:complete len:303 (+),score=53.53 TRINITY_DN784_c0_g1_i3:159-1067(+)
MCIRDRYQRRVRGTAHVSTSLRHRPHRRMGGCGSSPKEELDRPYNLHLWLNEPAARREIRAHDSETVAELAARLGEESGVMKLACGTVQLKSGTAILDPEMTLAEAGIKELAEIELSGVSEAMERALEQLISEMVSANSKSTEEKIRKGLKLSEDGSIESWMLRNCDLGQLPEGLGNIRVTGNLNLSSNQLTSLPNSFGNIRVGGNLNLAANQLGSLPKSFGDVEIGGNLNLANNNISRLDESFGSIKVEGLLSLASNKLEKLPSSFGSIEVGGDLDLSNNRLTNNSVRHVVRPSKAFNTCD